METVMEQRCYGYIDELFQKLSKEGIHPKIRRVSEELFREMYYQNPKGIFILNIRPVDDWIRSRLNHGEYWKWDRVDNNTTQEEVIESWKKEYENHIKNVQEFFKDKGNLIVFDISKHDGKYLCDSLKKFGVKCNLKYWKNYTRDKNNFNK